MLAVKKRRGVIRKNGGRPCRQRACLSHCAHVGSSIDDLLYPKDRISFELWQRITGTLPKFRCNSKSLQARSTLILPFWCEWDASADASLRVSFGALNRYVGPDTDKLSQLAGLVDERKSERCNLQMINWTAGTVRILSTQ